MPNRCGSAKSCLKVVLFKELHAAGRHSPRTLPDICVNPFRVTMKKQYRISRYSLFILTFRSILVLYYAGRDSVIVIATSSGLEGPGIESRWGRDFPHPFRPALGPTRPPIQYTSGLFPEHKTAGRGVNQHSHLAPRLKNEHS